MIYATGTNMKVAARPANSLPSATVSRTAMTTYQPMVATAIATDHDR